jgi:hypothetical protein
LKIQSPNNYKNNYKKVLGKIIKIIYKIDMNLKIGQHLRLKGKYTHNKVFEIIGFTPKRIHVYNIDLGTEYTWYIKENQIVKILK